MDLKKVMLVTMCVLLLAVVVMTGAVIVRVAPVLQALVAPPAQPPAQTSQPTDASSDPTQESTLPSQPTDPAHVHNYNKLIRTQKVTCTTVGYKVYECECGNTEIRDMETPAGHVWNDGVKQTATCTENGGNLFTCTNCGEEELRNEVEAKGHTFSAWSADPADPAKELRKCGSCGLTEVRDAENPTDPTENTDPAEGTDSTETTDPTLSTDPTEESEPTESGEPTACEEHDYQLVNDLAPETYTAGEKSYKCSVCEDTYVEYYGANGTYDLDAVVAAANAYAAEKGFRVIISDELRDTNEEKTGIMYNDAEDNGGQSHLVDWTKILVDRAYQSASESPAGPAGYDLWVVVWYGKNSTVGGTFNLRVYIG